MLPVQFEVINKDDQQALPAPLPLLHQSGDRLRPPRPAVRLSMQPYTATRQSRRQAQGSSPAEASVVTASGSYQNLALLPVSEPCSEDAGHLFDAFSGERRLILHSYMASIVALKQPTILSDALCAVAGAHQAYAGADGMFVHDAGLAQSNRALAGDRMPAQTAPPSLLSGYAEQLQRDLGTNSGSAPPQQPSFDLAASCPAPSGQGAYHQGHGFGPMTAALQSMPIPQTHSVGPPLPAASRLAASIGSAEGAAFTNPLMSMPGW